MKKLFSSIISSPLKVRLVGVLLALLATTTLFGQEYFSPISVTDGTAADWDALPAEYLAFATHSDGCSYDGLKSVKVYCDEKYLNILVEVNLDVVTDREWTPFQVFLNADGSSETGGFGDLWKDADTDLMLETAIYSSGYVNSYNPAVFKWWGEVGGSGWFWTDPYNQTAENCWGAIVCEGSYPAVGTSQMVDGDLSKVEIQILKERVPAQWADEFTIGVKIDQSWSDVGHLPNAADDEIGNTVLAEKLIVKVFQDLSQDLSQDGLHYEITSLVEPYTVAVVDADADITMATIPETIEYYGTTFAVTSIGYSAFSYCSSLVAVSIPNSVTSIEDGAFSNCSSLVAVSIPNSVTSIGGWAFASCSALTLMMVENGNTVYDSRQNCNAIIETATNTLIAGCQNTIIPNSVTSIGEGAFSRCSSLTSITIPESVMSIEHEAFYGCSSLTSISIPNSVMSIEHEAFYGCSSLTSITIPNSITSIEDVTFGECSSLTSITIPNSVTYIGESAFYGCSSLEYLSIPNSVKFFEIEEDGTEYFFDGFSCIVECYNLKTLTVPADFFGVDDLADYYEGDYMEYLAYLPKQLESLTINGGNMTHPFGWDFMTQNRKSLKHIDFGVTESIAEEAFNNFYNLESLVLPSQLETIPYMAVAECVKLKSISIPATVTTIEDRAFENCRMLSSVTFSKNGALTRIGNWAFYNNHELTNLVIPEGVTEVGHAAFYDCTYLKEMTLPSTMQTIADNAFSQCQKVSKITVNATTPPVVEPKTFEDIDRNIPLYVPAGTASQYKQADYWCEFFNVIEQDALSSVENLNAPSSTTNTQKLLRDGQLLILKDGKTYNAMGQEM